MSERSSQAELMARKREKERDITIEPVANPQRRLAAVRDPFTFLETYFPDRFYESWTDDRRLMVEQIVYRAKHGGDKAIAAPRGEGKTSLAECAVGGYAILTGMLRYPVIVASSGPMAENILSNIKLEYETNELLIADFPEVCGPIVALEGANQRAKMQTYRGRMTRLKWSQGDIQFPTVNLDWCPSCLWPEPKHRSSRAKTQYECPKCSTKYNEWQSAASGALIDSRGLDGAVRGLRRGAQRPDLVLLDDPETEESARSHKQIADRERKIENAIGGLGTGRRPVARLMLTTIQNTQCLSARYTDPHQKPSWDGSRLALVRRWPLRKDLWETYIELRQNGMQEDPPDKLGRHAHQFYVDNFDAMNEGVVVSNPSRFNDEQLEDGSSRELSTIEYVHNQAADKGWDYVFNELQNDPQEEDSDDMRQLSVGIVSGMHSAYRGRLNGLDPGLVPSGTKHLTAFVDVQHDRLYFSVSAWMKGRQRAIIDYGDYGAEIGKGMNLQEATMARIVSLAEMFTKVPYKCSDGGERTPDIVLCDSSDGNVSTAVYSACMSSGWVPSKGDARWKKPKDDKTNRGSDAWHITRIRHENKVVNLVVFSVEPFRHRCRDSWLLEPGETVPGSVFLWGDSSAQHRVLGEHMSVRFERHFDEKKGWREEWLEPRRHDLWDCDYGNFVAESIVSQASEQKRQAAPRKYGVLSKK